MSSDTQHPPAVPLAKLTPVQLGRFGEDQAALALRSRGYVMLDHNWRCPRGELDLVARDNHQIVFVEVKTRRGTRQGGPEEAVTPIKLLRLRRLASAWLQAHPDVHARHIRIDVVAITVRQDTFHLHHLRGVG